ncbi:hypothetical protein HMPREF1022_01892 [Desulfovibrio sp. 6_1_46AFAA]|nr:hypothetical protein HMPREF1022_01892 [Desulfovibrio sp. 6_1_46AFAA]
MPSDGTGLKPRARTIREQKTDPSRTSDPLL